MPQLLIRSPPRGTKNTEKTHYIILARAAGKSKRQIEELVAELSPKPDVPATMRRLPKRQEETRPAPALELGPERVAIPSPAPALGHPKHAAHDAKPAVVEPLAPARYKVQFTASAELHHKLERLRALMRSSVPDGDLAAIIEEVVTEKLKRIESKRFAKTKAPRKSLGQTDTSPTSRHIPAAVKRAVGERDRNQCTFLDDNGRRCGRRDQLEFHHRKPFGWGGDHSPKNIQLMCRVHNGYFAERDYGKEVMERHRRSASGVSEPVAVYTPGWCRSGDLVEPFR